MPVDFCILIAGKYDSTHTHTYALTSRHTHTHLLNYVGGQDLFWCAHVLCMAELIWRSAFPVKCNCFLTSPGDMALIYGIWPICSVLQLYDSARGTCQSFVPPTHGGALLMTSYAYGLFWLECWLFLASFTHISLWVCVRHTHTHTHTHIHIFV